MGIPRGGFIGVVGVDGSSASVSAASFRHSISDSLFGVVSRRRVDGWGSAAVWVNSYMDTPLSDLPGFTFAGLSRDADGCRDDDE